MENNVIKVGDRTIIFNGGNPLEGCPQNWDEARNFEIEANKGKEADEPQWKFDCGFKLDFDGPVVRVNSRFYPPKTHYGKTWDGCVTISVFGQDILNKEFDCKTIDELRTQVEQFTTDVKNRIESLFQQTT